MSFKSVKLAIICVFIIFTLRPNLALAEPDQNQIVYWLGTQDVIMKKNALLPNKHEKLKAQNIKELMLIKKNAQNKGLKMQETSKYTFKYFYQKEISCDASITYTWTRFGSEYELKAIIVDCQV
jgi:hypothetical protein